jgi:hypothetical protein
MITPPFLFHPFSPNPLASVLHVHPGQVCPEPPSHDNNGVAWTGGEKKKDIVID